MEQKPERNQGIYSKGALDLSSQYKQTDKKRESYSALIKYAHQRLIEEGRPKNYIMTPDDIAKALGIEKGKLRAQIRGAFGADNSQELLNGLGLPNNYIEEY